MGRWKSVFLLVLLASSGSVIADETVKSLDSLEAQIQQLNEEREDLQGRLLELEQQLAELARLRDQAAFEEGAKDGIYILTAMSSTLRETPDALKGKVLAKISEGTKLRALEFEYPFWKVEYRGIYGYLSDIFVAKNEQAKSYFMRRGKVSENPGRALNHPEGVAVPQPNAPKTSPTDRVPDLYSGSNSNPVRAAVQCSGYTEKGRRCKRMTTNPSGRCWQHE